MTTPGFAGFEINEMNITPNASSPVVIEQKLRAKTNLHNSVPLEITFLAADGTRHTEAVMVSGVITTVNVNVPFAPIAAWLNGNHKLNLANFADEYTWTAPDDKTFTYGNLLVNVTQMSSDAFLRVEHAWIPPDLANNGAPGSHISNSHYWKIDGLIPADFLATANFTYRGPQAPMLDFDLTANTEDSIVILYRAQPTDQWSLYDDFTKFPLSPSDGQGIIRVNNLRLGEYAFANGEFPLLTSDEEPQAFSRLDVFPNPGNGLFFLSGEMEKNSELLCSVFDRKGQLIQQINLGTFQGSWNTTIDLQKWSKGSYLLQIEDKMNRLSSSRKVIIQ
jgi:hypothetical protein